MKNQTIAAAVASMLPFMLSSCDKLDKGRKQTKEGLQYEMIVDEDGRKAKIGDFLTLHLVVSTEKDSVLNSTYKNGGPLTAKLVLPPMKGGLEDGFQLMSAGDSANFYISIDSLMKGQPEESRPKFFPKGSFVKYRVKMLKVLDSATAVAEEQKSMDNYGKKKPSLHLALGRKPTREIPFRYTMPVHSWRVEKNLIIHGKGVKSHLLFPWGWAW
jgi:hypothetical protein